MALMMISQIFFGSTIKQIENENIGNIIWGGDFNLVMNVQEDIIGAPSNHGRSVEVLNTYMDKCSLKDIWHVRNPAERQYS